MPEGEHDAGFFHQNFFEEFPNEIQRKLQKNKKGFYPKTEKRIFYAPIQNLLKHLQGSSISLKKLQFANKYRKTHFWDENDQKPEIEKLSPGGFSERKKKQTKTRTSLGKS